MSKILDLRQKRSDVWDKAKAFLDERSGENGLMSGEDTAIYERMEQEVVDLGHAIEREERAAEIERELNAPVRPALTSRPLRAPETRQGVASDAYKNAFWAHMRNLDRRSPEVRDALQVGTLSEGGYTVPDEFEHQLIQGLEEENIMRGLVHKITTSSGDRKIPLVTSKGAASWIRHSRERRHLWSDYPGRPQGGLHDPHLRGAAPRQRLRHGGLYRRGVHPPRGRRRGRSHSCG